MARIDEIALELYRISVYVPELELQFNHFLVRDDAPLRLGRVRRAARRGRATGDFAGLDTVTVVTRLPTGDKLERIDAVPVPKGAAELIRTLFADRIRRMPSMALDLSVIGSGGASRARASRFLSAPLTPRRAYRGGTAAVLGGRCPLPASV